MSSHQRNLLFDTMVQDCPCFYLENSTENSASTPKLSRHHVTVGNLSVKLWCNSSFYEIRAWRGHVMKFFVQKYFQLFQWPFDTLAPEFSKNIRKLNKWRPNENLQPQAPLQLGTFVENSTASASTLPTLSSPPTFLSALLTVIPTPFFTAKEWKRLLKAVLFIEAICYSVINQSQQRQSVQMLRQFLPSVVKSTRNLLGKLSRKQMPVFCEVKKKRLFFLSP